MTRVRLALLTPVVAAAAAAFAAPAEKLLQQAGPPPSDAVANAAIVKYFQGRNVALNRRKPFRVLSGPTLATGNTFSGGVEQAWLMCLVVNAERLAPGPADLESRAVYLQRGASGVLTVVSTENWKDSSPQCGGGK